MTNPTSNFGWQMPTNTDLVTDLPADFEVFGQAVDTSLADLKGGTTGQILSKATNTDMDFTWITNDVGDITEVAAGTGISGGGTSGVVTITNSMATAIDAKGDLVVGTAADTFSRLASSGVANEVLTVDTSTATGLKWAAPASGGMTLISTTTLSGASITLSSIPATYKDLYIIVRNFLPATDTAGLRMRFNSDSTASRHSTQGYAAGAIDNVSFGGTNVNISTSSDNAITQSMHSIYIPDYVNTTTWKIANFYSITTNATTTANYNFRAEFGLYNQTSAISSLDFFPSTGNFTSGSILLYGVK